MESNDLVEYVDKLLNSDSDISHILYITLFFLRKINEIKRGVDILLNKGYTILDMLDWYFDHLKIVIESNPDGLTLMNDVANYAKLDDILNRYKNKKYFDLWYNNILMNQV